MKGPRCITIHGHFYQPPRENPWLETIEVQDSALPYHDWNARVTAECYAPNSAARRVDGENRILDIVDNFARISFNVGPTLLAWLETARPDVYRGLLAADRASRVARGGHGNALAQPYNHPILPLCSRRDKVTQVRWGLADFRHRFGRDAEGMWLPETAADRETLLVLAEEGLRFTILAPHQAAEVLDAGAAWAPAGTLDTRRPYRFEAAPGRSLSLFFYDGAIAQGIAFGGLLHSGEALSDRLLDAFDGDRSCARLVHVATDGESYGHHHRFGEMALAAALARLEADGDVTLTNYGAFLAAAPPAAEVRIVEPSSWSCAHGVERWRADCGCRVGHPGWHQRWRAPLREALDWLRDTVDPLFEARASQLVRDPWAARDDYVSVVLDRSPAAVEAFLARHGSRPLDADSRVRILQLLELQRHRLLMYTSCGWFFDELSGLETVQVLRYAARVLQLARALGGDVGWEQAFVARLAEAPSNVPELEDGTGVWRRHVLPAVADLRRVIAHHAIVAPFTADGEPARVYAYDVERFRWMRETHGETSLAVGRVRATSRITRETASAAVAVLHAGGHDFHCALRENGLADAALDAAGDDLLRRFAQHGSTEAARGVDRYFGPPTYGIQDLFLEERRRLLTLVTESVLSRFEATYGQLYAESRRLLQYLRDVDAPAPDALAVAARHVLQRAVERELGGLARGGTLGSGIERVRALLAETASLGIALQLEPARVSGPLEAALLAAVDALETDVAAARVAAALGILELGRALSAAPDLWAAQNRAFRLWRRSPSEARTTLAPLLAALGFAAEAA